MITFAVVFLLMLTLPLAVLADGELDAKGIINNRPSGGNIGDWDIGGVIYRANASTVFEEHHGALAVGACAEVEYQVVGGVNKALKISSAEAQDCTTTPQSIQAELAQSGQSTVVDSINRGVKAGKCACEIRNPQGRCCLGNVSKVVKQFLAG